MTQRTNRLIASLIVTAALSLSPASVFSQGKIYAGVYPSTFLTVDEATGAVSDKLEIQNGAPMGMTLSADRTKFFMVSAQAEGIEIVDIVQGKLIDSFTLSSGGRRVRLMRNTAVHPDGFRLFSNTRPVVKEIDRYRLEKPQLVMIDTRERKITKTMELPKEYSGNGLMRVSPDGKFLYYLFRDILIIDIETMTIVDKILLRDKPLIPGTGAISLGTSYETFDQPGLLYFLYSSVEPTQNRRTMGIARFNLADRSLDYFETGPQIRLSGFTVTRDGKTAYGVRSEARLNEIYVFDLEAKRIVRRHEYPGHTRTRISVSTDGAKVYLEGPGNTIDYLDAKTFDFEKRVELPGDLATSLFVTPEK
jgi:hypothetical protein